MAPQGSSGKSGKNADAAQGLGSEDRRSKGLESDTSPDIIADLYPQLLEVSTDEDDEIDTRTLLEVLAGSLGLFLADYRSFYGHEKAMETLQDIVDISLNIYDERTAEAEAEAE